MRTIEIIFWGIALFVRDGTPARPAYTVLIPDARHGAAHHVVSHTPYVTEYSRINMPRDANWSWPKETPQNDGASPCTMEISGLAETPFDDAGLKDRLPHLRDSDPTFTLRENPAAVAKITIDRGKLTAHQFPTGMIAVKWTVQVGAAPIRIVCGKDSLAVNQKTCRS